MGSLDDVKNLSVRLYGSLGATGRGHGTDKAVVLGLEGELPESVDVDGIPKRMADIGERKADQPFGFTPGRFQPRET